MNDAAPVLYGKYQLLDLLARGGMAEVFRAKSHGVEGFEKVLVIKRILPELSENAEFVDMFINEAKIAVTLSHANIVQVFDLGRADETYFIAMEYVAGYDLATVIKRGQRLGRPMPTELAVYVASEVAKGLDYAHRRRDAELRPLHIVHRDVSPQNVLVSYEGEVKLTDFGIAKAALAAVDGKTEAGVLKGKYAYMAPEQARGEGVDARADLFALGIILYELVSHVNPFYVAESAYETLRKVRAADVVPLALARPDLPEELTSIVDRVMSAVANERQENAGVLYEELVQFLYSSGRRVSGHDLSDYLLELRRADEAVGGADDAGLRAMFDHEGGSGSSAPHDVTPIEVPVPRAGGSKGGKASRPPEKSAAVRPTQERRDVTALVLQSRDAQFMSAPLIDRLIRRFGGMNAQYEPPPGSPHTLLVLFGVRDPDGRDTEAAARFALRVVRSARSGTQTGRPDVEVSVGIHSGRMLVESNGDVVEDESFEVLADFARELADRAGSGQVWISEDGKRTIAGLFRTSPTASATGHGGTSVTYAVEEERSLADASGKFVGRREELRRVGEVLAAANRGRMKVISICGEAGTGKTRLLLETRRRLRLGGHDVGMYVATCGRQHRTVPLASVQEMLRAVLGIDELEGAAESREKVGRLRELGLGAKDVSSVMVALGLETEESVDPTDPGRLRSALTRIAVKLSQDRLTVFAWDGAENLDDESQALLDGMIRDTRGGRIAALLAYRPGFVHGWADVPGHFEIALGAMSDEDVAHLTGTRLAAEEVPLDLLREVTAKSGGNPLYVEEYLKALADAGAIKVHGGRVEYAPEVAVAVPKTLRGIVSSRLARLAQTDRQLLQVASVVGERFGPELLAAISGEEPDAVAEALTVLEGRGLVARANAEYDFSHDLICEVLRDGLTFDARRELHAAVASALEELYPYRLDELAERLAQHHREAGDRARAVDYLILAGDRLEAEHSLTGAAQALDRAIELLGQMAQPDRDRTLALYGRIGALSFRARDLEAGAQRMAAAVELAEALGRDDEVARFSMVRGRLLVNNPASQQDGRRWLDRAETLARGLGDRRLLRDVTLATAEADMRVGEHRTAADHFEEALSLSREMRDRDAQVRSLVPLALAAASDARIERALDALREARTLADDNDRFTECELAKMESLVYFFARDYARSRDAAARAIELAKEYGFPYEAAVSAHNLGEAHMRLGDYKRAFAQLRYSYEMARDHGWESLMWANMRVLGFIDATRFGSEEGRNHVILANEFARDRNYVWDLIQGRFFLAIIEQGRGDDESARAALREILRMAADHGHSDYVRAAERGLRALDSGSTIQLPG